MSEVAAPTECVSVTIPESETTLPIQDTRPVIGGLHLRSVPGACLLFAGVLLIVGISVAVGGYWNNQPRRQTHHASTGRTASEKLKLIGPVIMGVGLFIFICANTILYENRDRDQHQEWVKEQEGAQDQDKQEILPLVQTLRHGIYNSERFSQIETNMNTHTLNLSELNIHCLEEGVNIPTLLCSSPSSDSCHSSQVNLEAGSLLQDHRNMETLPLPVIKLNDCLIDSLEPEPPPLPERTYKMGVEEVTRAELTQGNPTDSTLMTMSNGEQKDR